MLHYGVKLNDKNKVYWK